MNTQHSKNINRGTKSSLHIYDLPDSYFNRYQKKMTIVLGVAVCSLLSSVVLWIIAMNMS